MKLKEIYHWRHFGFLIFTFFIGVLPIILYPFSGYFGKQNDYGSDKTNHGPLHQYPDGNYYEDSPHGVDWVIEKTYVFPMLIILLISIL